MDLPELIQDHEVSIHDFNTGAKIAHGRVDVNFTPQTGRYGVAKSRFTGQFRPTTLGDRHALKGHLLAAFSVGAPAHILMLEHGGHIWSFIVRFELGETAFPFSGRAEPKIVD